MPMVNLCGTTNIVILFACIKHSAEKPRENRLQACRVLTQDIMKGLKEK